MLVLTRKPGEKIVIAGNIVIEYLESRGGKVRLGITAPPDVVVTRGENLPKGGADGANSQAARQGA